jgi:GTP cyclohydrolase I
MSKEVCCLRSCWEQDIAEQDVAVVICSVPVCLLTRGEDQKAAAVVGHRI